MQKQVMYGYYYETAVAAISHCVILLEPTLGYIVPVLRQATCSVEQPSLQLDPRYTFPAAAHLAILTPNKTRNRYHNQPYVSSTLPHHRQLEER